MVKVKAKEYDLLSIPGAVYVILKYVFDIETRALLKNRWLSIISFAMLEIGGRRLAIGKKWKTARKVSFVFFFRSKDQPVNTSLCP